MADERDDDDDDWTLLARYVADASQTAFAELVRRHVDLVYGACLRQTAGDPHLAEDAAQAVFLLLAQRAPALRRGTILAGWLYRAAGYAAANAARGERRRRYHERKAARMKTDDVRDRAGGEPDSPVRDILPALDDALASLGPADRDAVLLRFFGRKSLGDVGAAMGVSEEAAKKRVGRAVGRLRGFFARRGLTVSAVALTAAATDPSHAAPPALAHAAAAWGAPVAAAATAASSSSNIALIAKGTGSLMTSAKLTSSAAAAVIAILIAGAGTALVAALSPRIHPPVPPRVPTFAAPASAAAADANAPAPTDAAAKARFDALYSLKPDEVLKHIAPPFPPERLTFGLRQFTQMNPTAPADRFGTLVFWWTEPGALERASFSTGPGTVQMALIYVLDAPPYMVEIPRELYTQPMSGDWIVRLQSSIPARLDALEPMLLALPKPVRIERRRAEREAIVARGRYAHHPLDGVKDPGAIHLSPDPEHVDPKLATGGGGTNTLGKFLAALAVQLNQHVIDQTTGGSSAQQVEWRNDTRGLDDRGPRRDATLKNLTQQTSLTFTIERRMVDVWISPDAK